MKPVIGSQRLAFSLMIITGLLELNLAFGMEPSWFPSRPCPTDDSIQYKIPPQAAVSSSEPYSTYSERARRRDCYKPWTILVYMAADNDLEPYAYWDLYEMEAGYASNRLAAGSTPRSDLLVQLSTPRSQTSKRIHVFQTPEAFDKKIELQTFFNRTPADIRSPIAQEVPRYLPDNKPVAPADDLESFIEWGVREYPATHYMVAVWGHGQGWAPRLIEPKSFTIEGALIPPPLATRDSAFAGRRFGGLAFQDGGDTFLDTPSLRRALKHVQDNWLGGKPIDVYASDACLMQMIEVATEISDSARFIVGSSQVETYLGLPYRRMMFEVNTGRFATEGRTPSVSGSQAESDEPYLMALMLPRLFRQSLEPGGLRARFAPEAIKTVTMSSISSDELRGALLPALSNMAWELDRFMSEDSIRGISIRAALQRTPGFMGGSVELGAMLSLLRQGIRNAMDDLEEELEEEVEVDPEELDPWASFESLDLAIQQAQSALHRTMISYALGTRYTGAEENLYLLGFRALSVWFPMSRAEYRGRIDDFSSSMYYQSLAGDWKKWLERLYP